MMNMEESAASAFLKPVLLLGSEFVKEFELVLGVTEYELVWGVKEELDKLSSYLSAIQSVLQDAEEKQIQSNQVRDWMRKLKDVAWDAEDVLDEVATEALRSKLEEDENQTSKWKQVCNFFFSCSGLELLYEHENPLALKSVQFRREISHKIKDINEKLERIAKERNDLHLRDGGSQLPEVIRKKPENISSVHESDVLGRKNDKEKLINLLVSDGSVSKELSVIPIVGMGGVGKTTLAQLIYDDENVKKHFDLRGRVSVSVDFDLIRLSKAIIESFSKKSSKNEEWYSLTDEIETIVRGKKFLLLLDDVWNEDEREWEKLRAPLRCGAKGSKIIVTTRSEKVSRIMGTIPHYSLKLLSDVDCWSLLGKRAFPTEGTWNEHTDLVAAGWEIAKKCRGLPLVVEALGGLLKFKKQEEKEWKDILNSEIWKLPQGGKYDILPALRLSYHHLPSHLKQCFLYCSIFPKDYEFDKDKLVKLWMAEGFITSKVGQRAMEDVGSDYFDDLLWRSFFQQYEKDWFGRWSYKMHDLIHDLAESLSEGECFRKEDDKLNHFSEKARYSLCITHKENDLTILKNKEYIEELSLSWQCLEDDDAMDPSVAEEVLERLQPHHNLRILKISNYNGERFPSWIGDPSFSKLVDVTLWDCRSCQTLPPLWQLPSLRKLKLRGFTVDGIMVTKVVFPSLEELSINSFPNLVEWRGGTEEEEDCFPCLGKLVILECESLIALPRFSTSVRELQLTKCNERILSSLSYFTSLSSLTIYSLENLKVIPSGSFKNLKALKDLSIYSCKELVSLVEDDEDCKHLHSLEDLWIESCSQLMVLPDEGLQYLVSLQRMFLGYLHKLTFLPDGLKNLISLKKLSIESCRRLVTLPKEGLPTTLQTLTIHGCPLLAEQCEKESGEYWPNLSYIPNLDTNFLGYPPYMPSLSSSIGASSSQQVVI